MPRSISLVLALTAGLVTPLSPAKKTISASEAKANIGQDVTVCGKVVKVRKVTAPRAGSTWQMAVDQEAPPVLTLIANANNFDNPFFITADARFSGKDVCADGKVMDHNGLIYIRLTEPRQIRIVKDKD
jgi:hypothetical protein